METGRKLEKADDIDDDDDGVMTGDKSIELKEKHKEEQEEQADHSPLFTLPPPASSSLVKKESV
jgi:hypothetical protein